MESKELKKIYSKMGKQLRKQGYDVKVVMTGRQQEMGTATMCFAYNHGRKRAGAARGAGLYA